MRTIKSGDVRTDQHQAEGSSLIAQTSKANWLAGWLKKEWLQAFLLLNLSLLVFFSTPLFTPNGYYINADTLQRVSNQLYDLPPPAKNNISFIDPLRVFYPQLYYSRERIMSGEIPLWNPYSANGMPHLASMQSAVFSPLSLPVYLLGMKEGWLLSQYLKLLVFGMFGYGFLQRLKIHYLIATASAIATMYCGYLIIWQIGPHGASVITLPMGLFFVESFFQARTRRAQLLNLAGLSCAEALGILGGHIESFFFGTLIVSLYILLKVWGEPGKLRAKLSQTFYFTGFGLLGVGLGAIQLIPFVEYLLPWAGPTRGEGHQYVPEDRAITNLFPTIFGRPEQPYMEGPGLHPPELYQAYLGAGYLFLTLAGLWLLRRNRLFWFFGLSGAALFGYVHNLFPFNVWLAYLPFFKQAVAQRAGFAVAFCFACTTALLLDRIYRDGLTRRQTLGLSLGGLAFILTGLGGAFTSLAQWKIDTTAQAFKDYVPAQLLFTVTIFGLVVGGALLLAGKGWWRWLAFGLILFGSFAQGGLLLKDVNGTTDGRYVFPSTPGTQAIQQTVGTSSLAFYQGLYLPSLDNLFYKIYEPRFFEALWVVNYEKLFQQVFAVPDVYNRVITKVSPRSLQLFGVEYLVADMAPDTGVLKSRLPDPTEKPVPLANGTRIEQTITSDNPELTGLQLYFGTYKRFNQCHLQFELTDVNASDKPVRRQQIDCSALPDSQYYTLLFPPISDAKGKTYRFLLWSEDSTVNSQVGIYLSPGRNPDTSLTVSGQENKGSLLYNMLYAAPNSPYKMVWQDSRFAIFRLEQAVPRYYSVGQTSRAASEADLWKMVSEQTFDPAKTVALGPESQSVTLTGQEYSPAKVLEEKPELKRLQLTRRNPGFLVTSLINYPGWKIFVNGREVPVVRTNFAFMGAPVPAGVSDIEIRYDPLSFKLGLAATLVSLLGLLGLLGWGWIGRDLPGLRFVTNEAH